MPRATDPSSTAATALPRVPWTFPDRRGAMYARGKLHHYRVEDGHGDLFLCPPAWIMGEPPMLVPAAAAGAVA